MSSKALSHFSRVLIFLISDNFYNRVKFNRDSEGKKRKSHLINFIRKQQINLKANEL